MSLPISAIQRRVAEHFGIRLEDMLSDRSARLNLDRARQVAYYLARELTPYSLPRIGRAFHRSHSTVMDGLRRVEEAIEADPALAETVRELRAGLNHAPPVDVGDDGDNSVDGP